MTLPSPRWLFIALLASPSLGGAQELVPRLVKDIDTTSYAGSSRPRDLVDVPNGVAFTAFGHRELWIQDSREGTIEAVLKRQEIRPLGRDLYAAREDSGLWTLWQLARFRLGAYVSRVPGGPFRSLGPAVLDVRGFGPELYEADDGSGRGLWTIGPNGALLLARLPALPGGRLARTQAALDQTTLFVARGAEHDQALWSTDGTPEGTRIVSPGWAPGATGVSVAGVLGSRALVSVAGAGKCAGPELWLSDGTVAGTTPLPEIVPGPACALISDAVVVGQRAFLVIDDRVHGRELWTTDGSAAGTRRLTNLGPADPFGAVKLKRVPWERGLFFFADDRRRGREPWVSNGSSAGTHRLADLCPGPCSSGGEALRSIYVGAGDSLLFAGSTPALGRELWVTDGSAAGTRLLGDLCPGPCGSDPDDAPALSYSPPFAYFTGEARPGERAQWVTDGTPAGTVRLSPPGVPVVRGASVGWAFAASNREFGEELWTTGSGPGSAHLWYDLERERDSGSYPQPLGEAAGRFVFSAFDAEHGRRLWSTDGSRAGTLRLPGPAPRGLQVSSSATAGGRTFIVGSEPAGDGVALWASNGLPGGNVRLTPAGVRVQSPLRAVGEKIFFFASDSAHGTELWVSSGTRAGTHLVADLLPGTESADLHPLTAAFDGKLLFRRFADNFWHAWVSDGTAAGTRPLLDEYPYLGALDRYGDYVPWVVEALGKVFFAGALPGGQGAVFVSDGTAEGTVPLIEGTFGASAIVPAGSKVYVVASSLDPASGLYAPELWVSDGTVAGVVHLSDTIALENGDLPPMPLGDGLLFASGYHQVWYTDGTPIGTVLLHDVDGVPVPSYDGRGATLGNRAVFANAYGFGPCLTWAPGELVHAIPGAPLCGSAFTRVGSRLFFAGFTPEKGAELWSLEP